MRIEMLYSDLCCLYGDKGNTMFLRKCLPEAEFIETGLNATPAFLNGDVDMVYLCSMSEKSQELVLSRLMPHREAIANMAKDGPTLFFFVGNAMELTGQYIQREDGSRVEALGLFENYAVRQTPNRFNSLMRVGFRGMSLLGFTSRFSHTHGLTEDIAFGHVELGSGENPDSKLEGIYSGKVLATYLSGPVLVANPDFAHWFLAEIGAPLEKLPCEETLRKAYELRLKDYSREGIAME